MEATGYSVIKFQEEPYPGCSFACIPNSWIKYVINPNMGLVLVSYPSELHPDTMGRVEKAKECLNKWKLHQAELRFKTDNYTNALRRLDVLQEDQSSYYGAALSLVETVCGGGTERKGRPSIAERDCKSPIKEDGNQPCPKKMKFEEPEITNNRGEPSGVQSLYVDLSEDDAIPQSSINTSLRETEADPRQAPLELQKLLKTAVIVLEDILKNLKTYRN